MPATGASDEWAPGLPRGRRVRSARGRLAGVPSHLTVARIRASLTSEDADLLFTCRATEAGAAHLLQGRLFSSYEVACIIYMFQTRAIF